MAHIFFIDPIEKLNIKKDSTLMMALTFQQMGLESYILFEKDFFVTNSQRRDSARLLSLKKVSLFLPPPSPNKSQTIDPTALARSACLTFAA